jgi:hypothetical protein
VSELIYIGGRGCCGRGSCPQACGCAPVRGSFFLRSLMSSLMGLRLSSRTTPGWSRRRPWVSGPVYTTCWASPSYVEALVGPPFGDSEELEVEPWRCSCSSSSARQRPPRWWCLLTSCLRSPDAWGRVALGSPSTRWPRVGATTWRRAAHPNTEATGAFWGHQVTGSTCQVT